MRFNLNTKIQFSRSLFDEFLSVFDNFGFIAEADKEYITITRLWTFDEMDKDLLESKLDWIKEKCRAFRWKDEAMNAIGNLISSDAPLKTVYIRPNEPLEIVGAIPPVRIRDYDFFDPEEIENDPLDILLRIK